MRRGGLVRPLVTGAAGSILVLVGASQSSSPFVEHSPGSWWFELGFGALTRPEARGAGVLLVYAGLVALVGSWLEICLGRKRHRPMSDLVLVLVAWAAPLVFVGPLFSDDAYSYVAQGQMVARGISPYHHGAAALGRVPLVAHVSPIWREAIAPYGPGFERLVEGYLLLTGHSLLGTLALLRLTGALAIAALAWGIPKIARATGHDGATAFSWAVLNPLVLLTLLGGMHNDALMLGLVVVGLVAATRGHPLLGTVACTLGAEVKAPALLAVVFIAWWSKEGSMPSRCRRTATHLVVAGAVLAVVGAASGLGWGWVRAAVTPGKVVSWLDPATAVGLGLSRLVGALGLGGHESALVSAVRAAALAAAALACLALVVGSTRSRWVADLGLAFLVLALLGPVVWPWYETWGLALMAAEGDGLARHRYRLVAVAVLSALGCVADFPPGGVFRSIPAGAVAGGAVLLGAGVALVGVQLWRVRPSASSLEP